MPSTGERVAMKEEAECQNQATELGDQFLNAVSGLFYGEDQSSASFVGITPPKDPLSLSSNKPKRHERNVSWGILPSRSNNDTSHAVDDGEKSKTSGHSRKISTLPVSDLGNIPPVIAIDPLASAVPAPLKPDLLRKRSLTSTHPLPTNATIEADSPLRRNHHKRTMTNAN